MEVRKAEIVICGAGIMGVSAAYFLAVKTGMDHVVLVDERSPLTLTSDKSTECYRNWWPGPGDAMVRLMNRSIDLMEKMAQECGNLFHLNRRGYLYLSTEKARIADLENTAREAESLGAGNLRVHDMSSDSYVGHLADGFAQKLDGADLLLGPKLIQGYFPYLSKDVVAALHVRRAGWLSAQQYGMWMLEQARAAGVVVIRGRVEGVDVRAGMVEGVTLGDGTRIKAPVFVNAAGPHLGGLGKLLDVKLPVHNERHLKSSFDDHLEVLSRDAPLVICADPQRLEWNEAEQALLVDDEQTTWLLDELPAGAHARPEGESGARSILALWDLRNDAVDVEFPVQIDPLAAELAVRGLVRILPGMQAYVRRMPRPFVDGGYYTKTLENRPLVGQAGPEGSYVIGAASGYGIMAAAGMADLLTVQITGKELPGHAAAFAPNRYSNDAYVSSLEDWGDSWQL
ncbi:MAG: FAD-binding oxidoreductase [Chloroflexi bacterium]|nr:FAD-dependent oxidoreductase [Chloroflexota bacterium]MQC27308.1 FAD-binding oxidoreductase [Chloroflexota bacterium]